MTRLAALLTLAGVIAWPLAFATTTVEDTAEITATVKDVDLADRLIILQRPDGSLAVVAVDPSIHRLDEIRAGDKVHVKYSRAMAVKILKSTATQLSTTITPSFQRSEGAFPGATASRQIRAVVRIDGIDLANYSVTITGQSGEPEIVYLSDPQLKNNLTKLKLGDIVEIVYTEVTAISVSPATDM
jgi:hypothetical protein